MTNAQTISAQPISAHDLADQLSAQRISVIDVREPMEYASGHIAGSLNVPLNRLLQADLPKGPLVLVCQSGNRSHRALRQLMAQGHPHPLSELQGAYPPGKGLDSPSASSKTRLSP